MMNTLTRWEPIRELAELQDRFSNLLGHPILRRTNGEEGITLADWSPLADITEDDHEYLITAELPDVRMEDVKVSVENGMLTISGERRFEKEEKKKKHHRIERSYGSFSRSFTLPSDANADKIKAQFKNGLLMVHLLKNQKTKPKQIEVQAV